MNKIPYKLIRVLFCLSAVFILSLSFSPPSSAYAEASHLPAPFEEHVCKAMDLIFFLDQTEATSLDDPNGLRQELIRFMIHWLANDTFYYCPEATHRIAIVEWGGEILLDWTAIAPDLSAGSDALENTKEQIFNRIVFSPSASVDYSSGFQTVAEQINYADETPLQGPPRTQLVLMIGGNGAIPCLQNTACAHYNVVDFFRKLRRDLPWLMPFNEDKGPYIFPIIFPVENPEFDQYLPDLEATAAEHGGEVTVVDKNEQIKIVKTVFDIANQFYPHRQQSQVGAGNYDIEPFLQQVVFYSFRQNPATSITVKPVEGEMRQADSSDRLFHSFQFNHPAGGKFNINFGSNTLVYIQTVRSIHVEILNLDEPIPQFEESGLRSNPQNPYYFQLKLTDQFNEVIKNDPSFPARISVAVTKPDGDSYTLEDFTYNGGVFSSKDPLHVNDKGDYEWQLTVQSPGLNQGSSTAVTLAEQTGSYLVREIIPFRLTLTEPHQDVFTLHGGPGKTLMKVLPLPVNARLTTLLGEDLDSGKVFTGDVNQSVQVVVTHMDTGEQEIAHLRVDRDDPALFVGEIGESLPYEGEYRLELQLTGQTNTEVFRRANMPFTSRFARRDNLFTSPGTYQVIAAIILAILTVLIILFIYQHTSPVRGALSFYRPGGEKPFYTHSLGKGGLRKVQHDFQGASKVSPVLWHIRWIDARMYSKEEVDVTFYYQDDRPETKTFRAVNDQDAQVAEKVEKDHTDQIIETLEQRIKGPIYVRYENNKRH